MGDSRKHVPGRQARLSIVVQTGRARQSARMRAQTTQHWGHVEGLEHIVNCYVGAYRRIVMYLHHAGVNCPPHHTLEKG